MFDEGWAAAPLRWAMEKVGVHQFARMAGDPGLVAAVDQHAAAVRDDIDLVDAETLGDYALGFIDEVRERGWEFTGEQDFATLRLTAICRLAREAGFLTGELPA